MKMNVMLMAAGEGTRLRPFTLKLPKPAIPLLGAPLLGYSLAFMEPLEVQNLVVNLFHLPDSLRDITEKLKPKCRTLLFSDERAGLLNSGGGLHKALPHLVSTDPFLMMNADEVLLPLQSSYMTNFLAQHQREKALATLMVMPHPEVGHKFGGAWTQDSKNIVQFAKKNPGGDLRGHHFIGPILFSPRIEKFFKNDTADGIVPENILYDTLTSAISAGEKVQVHATDALWFESGNREDFLQAASCLRRQLAEKSADFSTEFLKNLLQRYGGYPDVVS